MQNGQLDDQDIDELVTLCLDPALPFEPISAAHVSSQGVIGEPITLLRIENTVGINALAPDQTLKFGKWGLSIVYGDNGSGKSGYVRILKHACRSRDRNSGKILRDVEDAAATPQSATIVFARGSAQGEHPWTPEAQSHADLPSISIFDSRSANVHVEKTNAVAYIPAADGGDGGTCRGVRPGRREAHSTAKRDCRPDAAGDQLAAAQRPYGGRGVRPRPIGRNPTTRSWNCWRRCPKRKSSAWRPWTPISRRIRSGAAAKITNQKARLDDLCVKLAKMVHASTGAAFAARDALKADWDTKADAARVASDALFAASPLPDVGKAIWTTLWEAARKYSDTVAYPEKTFPDPEGTDELCVLCQQPLSEEAINRRITFEIFVKGTTKAEEDAAAKAYGNTVRSAAALRMSISAVRQLASLIAAEIGNEPLAKRIRTCGIRAAWRLRALTRQHDAPSLGASYPAPELDALSADLAQRAALLSADQDSPEHVALVKERGELKDREALGPLVADIKAEIKRRKKAEAIAKAAKDTAKRSVTTKNKELSDKLVTNALRGRFAREIEKLKLSRMPVELRKVKDANAVSYFQVCLVEKPNEPVGEIFSEGEHRCVALAAFLAELVTSKQYSGIVFDDPMSSLDHIHRKAVAARLIEEAQHRQVIVFTHDLTFLFELRREAEAQARPRALSDGVPQAEPSGLCRGRIANEGEIGAAARALAALGAEGGQAAAVRQLAGRQANDLLEGDHRAAAGSLGSGDRRFHLPGARPVRQQHQGDESVQAGGDRRRGREDGNRRARSALRRTSYLIRDAESRDGLARRSVDRGGQARDVAGQRRSAAEGGEGAGYLICLSRGRPSAARTAPARRNELGTVRPAAGRARRRSQLTLYRRRAPRQAHPIGRRR